MAGPKLTEAQRAEIRRLLADVSSRPTDAEIARKVGVSRATVARMRQRLEGLVPPGGKQVVTKGVSEQTDAPAVGVFSNEGADDISKSAEAPAGSVRDEAADGSVTQPPDGTGDSSLTRHHTPDESPGGTEGSTRRPNGPGLSPVTEVVTNRATPSVLAALLAELEDAPAEEVDALRRKLLTPPEVALPERRRVPRRTYAWYLPEELGEAVKAKAKAEGVPPSEVDERILWQAKAAGWV